LKASGRFYLTPKENIKNTLEEWYKVVPVGKNKLAKFIKLIIQGTNLEESGKNSLTIVDARP